MRAYLTITTVAEAAIGVVLLMSPSLPVSLLLGARLEQPVAAIVARVAGAALLALAVACWFARNDGHSRAVRGLFAGLLIYNVATIVLLVYAALALDLAGVALWPTVLLHTVLTLWCLAALRIAAARADSDGS